MSIIKLFTCSLGVQLSFTLLNSDPASLYTEWNIEQAIHGKQLFCDHMSAYVHVHMLC